MINNRQNGRRRGRGGAQVRGPGGNPDRGNRIDNRSRGNAAQLLEKYKSLARDAQMQGDRVMTEYYHQFADHYFRVLAETRQRFEDQNQHQQHRQDRRNDGYDDDGDDDGDGDGFDAPREERREQRPPREDRAPRAPEPQPEAAAPVEYALEGEPATEAGERRPRGRRPRQPQPVAAETAAPRIDADRLPPAVGEAPVVEAEAGDEEPPVRRRRVRRTKVTEDGDSSVAA